VDSGPTGRIESRRRDVVAEEREELPDVSLLVCECQLCRHLNALAPHVPAVAIVSVVYYAR